MDILSNIYSKSVTENERNLRFWEHYLTSLKELDLKAFSDKLTVPVLVPIGSKILFRGEVKHTSEVTVSIGADYFTKCSIAQAELLRQHRIKDAQSKVDMYIKGKEYLENQLSFRKENFHDDVGQEIVEVFSEEEDKAWRLKHRENVKQYKTKSKTEQDNTEEVTDEELWNRLEELELQEELEHELSAQNTENKLHKYKPSDTFVEKEEDIILPVQEDNNQDQLADTGKDDKGQEISNKIPSEISKYDLLQKVISRQNELDEKLQALKQTENGGSKTASDLLAKLDKMEQLDELEDEMNRLDDIIETEDLDSGEEEDSLQHTPPIIKRTVSFADEDVSETIEITFKHSNELPSLDTYDPNNGIKKPSDIYKAYPSNFSENRSILKKTNYSKSKSFGIDTNKEDTSKVIFMQTDEDEEYENKTVIVGDIVEKIDQNGNLVENTETRPISLFKKKRMQKKS